MPHPPVAEAGPVRSKATRKAQRQAKRITDAPRCLEKRLQFLERKWGRLPGLGLGGTCRKRKPDSAKVPIISDSKATPSGSFSSRQFRRIGIGEDLEMIGVSDLLASIHVNEHGHRYPLIGPCGNRNERRPQLGGTGLGPLVLNALILYRLCLTRLAAVRS